MNWNTSRKKSTMRASLFPDFPLSQVDNHLKYIGDHPELIGNSTGCLAGVDCRPSYMMNQAKAPDNTGYSGNDGEVATPSGATSDPKPVSKKEAVKEAHRQVGKQTERGTGRKGSPMRGNTKKGYRLDPPNPKGTGLEKTHRHVNWWDYTQGKRKSGGRKGYIPIKHKEGEN